MNAFSPPVSRRTRNPRATWPLETKSRINSMWAAERCLFFALFGSTFTGQFVSWRAVPCAVPPWPPPSPCRPDPDRRIGFHSPSTFSIILPPLRAFSVITAAKSSCLLAIKFSFNFTSSKPCSNAINLLLN